MAKLYLTANSDAIRTLRTARGHHWVKCALQSWDGSVYTSLTEDGIVEIRIGQGSEANPWRILWSGTLAELHATDGLAVR